MDVGLILKIAGVGIIVAASCQVLSKSGRDEQSMLVSVAGIIVVLLMITGKLGQLFEMIKDVFGL
ncbi:MAG TPA: stage III sporulation protein AC [Bacillota bacterium]|nr:stage III sporulation protein AC [Clostridiales bacterium]HOQ14807.1 stage III sporulation protein AC [Bacillota bacterium]HPU17889.1 stage III sporulation protein AC [Bacillota bacterium]